MFYTFSDLVQVLCIFKYPVQICDKQNIWPSLVTDYFKPKDFGPDFPSQQKRVLQTSYTVALHQVGAGCLWREHLQNNNDNNKKHWYRIKTASARIYLYWSSNGFFLSEKHWTYLSSIFVLSSQIWTDRASFFEIVCWRNSHCEVTITDGRGMSLRSGWFFLWSCWCYPNVCGPPHL